MMPGVDMNRVHLFMGLTHPLYGPMNLATYSYALWYTWYTEWIRMMIDVTYVDRSKTPPPRT